jgi:Antibiotic biosynthesis monooxygenase
MRTVASSATIFVALAALGLLTAPGAADQQPAKQEPAKGFPDLVGSLKASPGCLGVETAKTGSGKQVIFAWFEDKKAVLKWYYSDTHREVMKKFFPAGEYSKPLKELPDDSGPIMAIASITFAAKPQFKETPLPILQISIELYQPVSGGVSLGGRFAPAGLKVPHLRDYTPKDK